MASPTQFPGHPPGPISTRPSLVVVGAGCAGLAVGLQLLLAGYTDVHLVTKDCTPRTCSDAAGALWRPFGEGSESNSGLFAEWGGSTFRFLNSLRLRYGSEATGICLVSGFEVFRTAAPQSPPFWTKDVLNFRVLSGREVEAMGMPGYAAGYSYASLIVDMEPYMQWLHREFYRLGGRVHMRELKSMGDVRALFPAARLAVNCAGLGGGALANDAQVIPVAGHILKVKLPSVHHFFMDADNPGGPCYIFPRRGDLVVGGTYHKGRSDTAPNPCTRQHILSQAARFVPELADAKVESEYVGLRPYRECTRVERGEDLDVNGSKLPLLHNYGHGGSGVTLHWGCAETVLQMVEEVVGKPQGPPPTHIPSRL